jgi:hypothetical protein
MLAPVKGLRFFFFLSFFSFLFFFFILLCFTCFTFCSLYHLCTLTLLRRFTMTTSASTYDFTAINNATRGMTAGMKLAVAQGLLTQAISTLEKFDNPLSAEANTLGEELKTFRIKYKEEGDKARAAAKTTA